MCDTSHAYSLYHYRSGPDVSSTMSMLSQLTNSLNYWCIKKLCNMLLNMDL